MIPPPDSNPLAVLFGAIAAVCVLSLAGLGLWADAYQAGRNDAVAETYPVPCVSSK